MSLEGITDFVGRLAADEELQREIVARTDGMEPPEASRVVVEIGERLGHEFSVDEALRARAILLAQFDDDHQLTEDELEAVAGGGWGDSIARNFNQTTRSVDRWGRGAVRDTG